MMGAKKVFEVQDDGVMISQHPTPWTIDNLIYLDLELWQTLIEFTRIFSESDANDLELYGTASFTENKLNHKPENLIRFRSIMHACLNRLAEEASQLHTTLTTMELVNPLIDEEYSRVCRIIIKLIDICLEKNIFYTAWTE